MKALADPLEVSTARALEAGCDVVLHCNGDMAEMQMVAGAAPALSGSALARAEAVLGFLDRIRRDSRPMPFEELLASFAELTGTSQAAT